jgi:AbrB family looped-hinge helix DNA binding protein
MILSSTVSSKGQVTIPIEIRRQLGLTAGSRVQFVGGNGEALIRTADNTNPFAKYAGILAGHGPSTIEGIVREERIRRGHDPEPPVRNRRRRRSG